MGKLIIALFVIIIFGNADDIFCDENNPCSFMSIDCDNNKDCNVYCIGEANSLGVCSGATINCPTSKNCIVTCDNLDGMAGMNHIFC